MRRMQAILPAIAQASCRGAVPLLVLRLPGFQETAWRCGAHAARILERRVIAAFRDASRRIVRRGDLLAHDRGSDVFAVVLVGRGRGRAAPDAADCRVTLERLVSGITSKCDERLECGWWAIERADAATLDDAVTLALERGRRERERYEFLATVGHELRTPLASIRGYLETVLEGSAGGRNARRFLETAKRETLRLAGMVDGMLEFSLLDLSPPVLALQCCDARERLRTAADTMLPLAQSQDVSLLVEEAPPLFARIGADACAHVLTNLLDNAIRYGGARVRAACRSSHDIVIIEVEDDGAGYDGRVRGHGLGLTIARTIVERAGGELTLAASQLGGTRATVRLPRARAERRGAAS